MRKGIKSWDQYWSQQRILTWVCKQRNFQDILTSHGNGSKSNKIKIGLFNLLQQMIRSYQLLKQNLCIKNLKLNITVMKIAAILAVGTILLNSRSWWVQ